MDARANFVSALSAFVEAIVDDRLAQSIKAPEGWSTGPGLNTGGRFTGPGFSGEGPTTRARYPLSEHETWCGIIAEDIKDWTKKPGNRLRYTYAGYYMQKRSKP